MLGAACLEFIQTPGQQRVFNGFIERNNRLYREAVLDSYLFFDLDQVRQLAREWMKEYNLRWSHESLDTVSPDEWNKRSLKGENL